MFPRHDASPPSGTNVLDENPPINTGPIVTGRRWQEGAREVGRRKRRHLGCVFVGIRPLALMSVGKTTIFPLVERPESTLLTVTELNLAIASDTGELAIQEPTAQNL